LTFLRYIKEDDGTNLNAESFMINRIKHLMTPHPEVTIRKEISPLKPFRMLFVSAGKKPAARHD